MKKITDNEELKRQFEMFPKVNKRLRFLQQLEKITTDFKVGKETTTLEIEDGSYDLFMLLFGKSALVKIISDFKEEKQIDTTLLILTRGEL